LCLLGQSFAPHEPLDQLVSEIVSELLVFPVGMGELGQSGRAPRYLVASFALTCFGMLLRATKQLGLACLDRGQAYLNPLLQWSPGAHLCRPAHIPRRDTRKPFFAHVDNVPRSGNYPAPPPMVDVGGILNQHAIRKATAFGLGLGLVFVTLSPAISGLSLGHGCTLLSYPCMVHLIYFTEESGFKVFLPCQADTRGPGMVVPVALLPIALELDRGNGVVGHGDRGRLQAVDDVVVIGTALPDCAEQGQETKQGDETHHIVQQLAEATHEMLLRVKETGTMAYGTLKLFVKSSTNHSPPVALIASTFAV
jgi:hypothetical protein